VICLSERIVARGLHPAARRSDPATATDTAARLGLNAERPACRPGSAGILPALPRKPMGTFFVSPITQ